MDSETSRKGNCSASVLAINLSLLAQANLAEMDSAGLYNDRDFRWAVQKIVTGCRVKDDIMRC